MPARSAQEVIDQAVKENSRWESVCLGFLVSFAAAGLVILVVGAVRGDGLVALAGAVSGVLLWPALREAKAIRDDNVRIRMHELALSKAKTAAEVVTILEAAIAPPRRNR